MNKIGFGFLRLPKINEDSDKDIDWGLLNDMVDEFISKGGYYFDTAYTYMSGYSEMAIRESVIKRYPRDKVWIVDKLPSWEVKSHEDCYKYYNEQLERCGAEAFDTYLLHWLNRENYLISEKYDEFGFLRELKDSGKVKKIGFSYHDNAELLDEILTKHPEVDVVQLQLNYLDWISEGVQSKKCYDIAVKHNKPVIVMEPVKGGTLADLPDEAKKLLEQINPGESTASWALRFAQSPEHVELVLSGMSTMEQIKDNMRDVDALSRREEEALEAVKKILTGSIEIPCTACRYCAKSCPQNINIPQYFSLYNEYKIDTEEDWKIIPEYEHLWQKYGKASDCIKCGNCEKNCPQKIEIIKWLEQVAGAFEG